MNISYFDFNLRKHVSEWPEGYKNIWEFSPRHNSYVSNKLKISEDGFSLEIAGMYSFCCGVREIGDIYIEGGSRIKPLRDRFIKEIEGQFPFENVGALSYTIVKFDDGESYHTPEVYSFITNWPGASKGEWFYNPNSGHYVQQWTLPINQHKIPVPFDDEED